MIAQDVLWHRTGSRVHWEWHSLSTYWQEGKSTAVDTHRARHFSTNTDSDTDFIKVLNHTVDTHGPARRLLHQVWSQARVKLALLRWVDKNHRLSEVLKHAHGLPSLWDSTYLVAAGSGRWFVRPCVGMSSHPKVVLMWVGADHRNPSVLTDITHRLWSFFLIYCAQPSGPEQPKVLQVSNSCYHRSELLIQSHSCLLTFSDSSD